MDQNTQPPNPELEIVKRAKREALEHVARLAKMSVVPSIAHITVTPQTFSITIPNLSPFLSAIQQANENIQCIVESFQKGADVLKRVCDAINTVPSIVDAYRKMRENARLHIQKFLESISHAKLMESISVWMKGLLEMRKRFELYDTLKRALRGDPKALKQVPRYFSVNFRRYKSVHTREWSVEEFSSIVLEKFVELLKKFGDLEQQAITVFLTFLKRLFYELEDLFRSDARTYHFESLNQFGIRKAAITHNGLQYVLIPSLAYEMDMSEVTLRRWAQQGLLPAVKLPYTLSSGYEQLMWHIPLTQEMFTRLTELRDIPERTSKHRIFGSLSRKEVARSYGVPESTLKFWEKRGIISPDHKGRRVAYTPAHLEQLTMILDRKRSPSSLTPAFQLAM